MARQKHSIGDIVLKNYKFIRDYYERAIRSQKIFISTEGQEEFQKIMLSANEKEDIFVPVLTNWIEKHVQEDLWERCKTAIRQHKLMVVEKKKHEYKTFRIPVNLFYDITFYAKKVNLSKFEAMKQAIEIASKML